VIVDLRRPNEREREPNRRWAGFAATLIENDIAQEGLDEWGAFIARSDLTVESFRNYMLDYYRDAPFQPRIIDLYRRYFHALAEGDGAVLVHCAAGKDRTGIACALTHHLMGVHSDDIVADYLLTNDTERQTARLPLIREAVREANGSVASDAALMTAMRVEAEYLDEAFAAIRSKTGSPDGYIETVLGLDGAQREAIRGRLLA
jgi:protein tyrosine/serine phosphatase